jgi:hypothetical protein
MHVIILQIQTNSNFFQIHNIKLELYNSDSWAARPALMNNIQIIKIFFIYIFFAQIFIFFYFT